MSYNFLGPGDPEKVNPNLLFDYKAFFCRLLPHKLRPSRYEFKESDDALAMEMKPTSTGVCIFFTFCYSSLLYNIYEKDLYQVLLKALDTCEPCCWLGVPVLLPNIFNLPVCNTYMKCFA